MNDGPIKPGSSRKLLKKRATNEPAPTEEVCGECGCTSHPYEPSFNQKYAKGIKILKDADVLNKVHVIPPQRPSKIFGYRTHAKLAVRKSGDPAQPFSIGLFKPGTHQVVDASECALHRESINRLIHDLKDILLEANIAPYDEISHTGDLRYLAIRAAHLTDELMVTFVMTKDGFKNDLRNIVKELKNREHQVSAAYLNINSEVTNVIFGTESKHISGAQRLRERICDLNFEIGPTSFFQVNPWTAETMYRRIEQLVGYGNQEVAWDLYSGVGQISTVLSRAGFRVFGVEMNPQSVRDAQKNTTRNFEENLPQFQVGKVEEVTDLFPSWAHEPNVIITNPARKGLDTTVVDFISEKMHNLGDTDFIYMSCEVESLARDLKAFKDQGLKLKQIEAYDMFPFTDKMEWLAIIKV